MITLSSTILYCWAVNYCESGGAKDWLPKLTHAADNTNYTYDISIYYKSKREIPIRIDLMLMDVPV